ncbi:hypothetical protein ACQVP2_34000 [Methylobacterium aquaticum]|uniref:hypothetical protein n=1 Tax=Methylobacterium aquaticum TaxID=270351 RepID=UPI003D186B7B
MLQVDKAMGSAAARLNHIGVPLYKSSFDVYSSHLKIRISVCKILRYPIHLSENRFPLFGCMGYNINADINIFVIEHFPTKWIPVRRRKCGKIKELEHCTIST